MQTNTIYAGVFQYETGQRFLQLLMQLTDRGFRGLYQKCARNLHGDYYQKAFGGSPPGRTRSFWRTSSSCALRVRTSPRRTTRASSRCRGSLPRA